MKVKKLYGCLNTETGELVGNQKYAEKKYAYCMKGYAINAFRKFTNRNAARYKIVELRPIPLFTEEKICQEQ